MSIFRRMMTGGGDKPKFVDWIKFNGSEYINTGIYYSALVKIKCTITIGTGSTWRLDTPNIQQALHLGLCSQNTLFGYWGFPPLIWGNEKTYTRVEFDIKNHRATAWHGTDYGQTTNREISTAYYSQFHSDVPIIIGACVSNTGKSVYDFGRSKFTETIEIYDDDVLVRSFRPCFYNGQYGLWDTISKKFYGNSGTGTITGGYD